MVKLILKKGEFVYCDDVGRHYLYLGYANLKKVSRRKEEELQNDN